MTPARRHLCDLHDLLQQAMDADNRGDSPTTDRLLGQIGTEARRGQSALRGMPVVRRREETR